MIDFAAFETRLAAHLRDSSAPPPPGLAPARLAAYRELAFSTISQLLVGSFPRLAGALGEAGWAALVQGFMRDWRATTPYFTALPAELLAYLEATARPADPAWMIELARFEALEVEVALDPADPAAVVASDVTRLRPNPCLRLRAFQYAVHEVTPGAVPAASPCYLALWRDRVGLSQRAALTPATARLVEQIVRMPERAVSAQLNDLASALGQPGNQQLQRAARNMLEELIARDLLLGTLEPR